MGDVTTRLVLQDEASSKLDKVSSSAQKAATQLRSVGRQIDSAFRSNAPDNFTRSLADAVDEAESEVESLGEMVESMFDDIDTDFADDLSEGFDDAFDSANELAEATQEMGRNLDDVADSADSLGDSIDDIGSGDSLGDLADSAEDAGNSMDEADTKANSLAGTLKKLFAAIGAAAVLKEVGDFAKESIEIGENYTSMMSEVQAISGATGSELMSLQNTAREYGATTVFSATEAAEALKYMSLAGWSAEQSSSALGGVLDLAAASGMGLGQASDMVTDYLSAFGMEAKQSSYFADMLAFAQAHSNTTAEQLGEAYRNSAANLNAAGQDVETVTSLLEGMANQGFKGSEAGTSLTAVMRDITNKMSDGAIKIGETSVAVQDAQGNFRDLTDILLDVEKATDGMGDAERATALSNTFTADSIKGMNLILNEGVENIAGYEEALRHAGGAASDMADTMNDNLTGDKAALSSAWEEMQIQVFESMESPLREGVQYLTNDVVPTLTEWVPDAFGAVANAISGVGSALKPVIDTVLKNPSAVAAAFSSIGTGMVAFAGINRIGSIANLVREGKALADAGGITGGLAKLATVMGENKWALLASGVIAAVAGTAMAVEHLNQLKVEDNLSEHFGDIHLDDIQVDNIASQIVPVEITAQLEIANTQFDQAEQLKSDAEEKLKEIDYINWEINHVTGTITQEQGDLLISNTDAFVKDVKNALEKEEYAAELTVKALLGSTDSTEIVSQMQEWFSEDMGTLDSLGNAVKDLLQKSIEEGATNVDTQTAISILQAKMMDMVNGAKQAELEGSLDWLMRTNPDAALDAESWAAVITKAGEYQTALVDAEYDSYNSAFQYLEQLAHNDPSRRESIDSIKDVLTSAYNQTKEATSLNVWDKAYTSLDAAYSSELETAKTNLGSNVQEWLSYAKDEMEIAKTGQYDTGQIMDSILQNGASNISGELDGTTRKALADRYETMLPTIDQLKGVIDSAYGENGEQLREIPTAIMDAYNQAMELGASAGDEDATYAYMARGIAESFGSKEDFMAELEAAGMNFNALPEALQDGINRAFTETSNDMDYSQFLNDLVQGLSGEEVDWANVESLLNQYGYSIKDALAEQGIDIDGAEVKVEGEPNVNLDALGAGLEGLEYTGDTLTLETGVEVEVFEVTAGDTMSGIAEKVGTTLDELIAANPQIENPNVIEVGQKINIPSELVDVDSSGITEAASQMEADAQAAADAATSDPIETEQTVNETYVKGEEDKTALTEENAVEDSEPVEQKVPTTITFEVASLDNSALAGAISEQLATGDAVPVTVPADITVEQGTFDASGSLTSTQTDLNTAYATAFPVNGTADITIAKASDNIAALYSQVGSELQSAFNQTYSVSTSAVITVNYSLANPTANISFSGGGTGSSTISASLHAEGGYFDTPHVGIFAEAGGEWFIPNDGSDRSKGMVLEAGRMLGMDLEGQSNIAPVNFGETAGESKGESRGSTRTVNVNVNGAGNIQVTGNGASKESIVNVMLENLRDVLMNIVQQEIIEEGDGAYEF